MAGLQKIHLNDVIHIRFQACHADGMVECIVNGYFQPVDQSELSGLPWTWPDIFCWSEVDV